MKTAKIQIILGLVLVFNTTISHAERFVIINGQRLDNQQLYSLQQTHCGPIADGNYWLNYNTGLWGYAGNSTPQGYITDNCYQQQERRPGLSERGLLYSPGELLR